MAGENARLLNDARRAGRPHAWDDSVGVGRVPPDDCGCCSCQLCVCCGQFDAWYFTYGNGNVVRGDGRMDCCPNPCLPPGGSIRAPLNGSDVEYAFAYSCCGSPTGAVRVAADGRDVGTVDVNHLRCCCPDCTGCACCGSEVVINAKDARGNSRFTMRELQDGEEGCCERWCSCDTQDWCNCCDCRACCYKNQTHAIFGPDGTFDRRIGEIVSRRARLPCCVWCCPPWVGYKNWPRHSGPEEKLLLVGMLHGAVWLHHGFHRIL
jgi:hypothetical protein